MDDPDTRDYMPSPADRLEMHRENIANEMLMRSFYQLFTQEEAQNWLDTGPWKSFVPSLGFSVLVSNTKDWPEFVDALFDEVLRPEHRELQSKACRNEWQGWVDAQPEFLAKDENYHWGTTPLIIWCRATGIALPMFACYPDCPCTLVG